MARKTKQEAMLTRNAILDAGEQLFIARGFQRVTLDEIAKHAKVTRGAVYWHFCNKSDLLWEIFVRLRGELRKELHKLSQFQSGDDGVRKVVRFCRMMLPGRHRKDCPKRCIGIWAENYGLFLDDPTTAIHVGKMFQEIHETLSEVIRRSRADPHNVTTQQHQDPEADAFLLHALLVGCTRLIAVGDGPR
jgi:AcrR family transcriptional regulator